MRAARLVAVAAAGVLALTACSGSDAERADWPPLEAENAHRLAPEFFGMHDNDWTSPPSVQVGAANFTTSAIYWKHVETSPGSYDFSRLDAQVAAAEENHARPMLVLGGTPDFHATGPGTDGDARTAVPDTDAWAAYVAAVAERYGDRLDYQIWPEPNIEQNWAGSAEQMAELTALASQEVRRVAPDATVVSPAAALRLPAQMDWFRSFFAAEPFGRPTADWVDVAAVDPFPLTDGTPEDSVALVEEARSVLEETGAEVPIWTNEINYGVLGGGVTTPVEYDDEQASAYVARTYLLHADAGVQRVYWLGWFDAPGMAIAMADDAGEATSAGKALATTRDWMTAGEFGGCDETDGVHRCLVGDDVVLWTESGSQTVDAPDGLTATSLDGKESSWDGSVTTSPVRVSG